MIAVAVAALVAAPAAWAGSWTALMVGDSTSANGNNVTPIDVATDTPGTKLAAGNNPFGIAVSPDGQTAYVADFNSNNGGSDGVTPIDLTQSLPLGLIATDPMGGKFQPLNVAVSPDGKTLWAVYPGQGQLERIDLTTSPPTVGAPFSDGTTDGAVSIALSPDGTRAYVTDQGSENQVSVLDLTQSPPKRVATVSLGAGATPLGIGVSPDGTKVFVADTHTSTLTVIDTATLTPTNVTLPSAPYELAVAPDGKTVWVTLPSADSVVGVDVSGPTPTVGTPIPVPFPDDPTTGSPQAIAITPDGQHLYVGDGYFGGPHGPFGNQTVDVPIPSGAPQTAIAAGDTERGAAVTPDQAPVANFTATSAPPGQPVSFDASSSTLAVGSIVSYAWSFGDGTSATTTTPTTTHVYAANGTYTATVTETDSAGTSTSQVYTGQSVLRNGGPSATSTKSVIVSSAPQPAVTLSPTSLAFGTVHVGLSSSPLTVTVTNAGQAPLAVSSVVVGGTDPDDFALTSDACAGSSVAPGASCTVAVTFTPKGSGTRTASLAINDNASGSPQIVALGGSADVRATLGGHVRDAGQAGQPPLQGATVELCPDVASFASCQSTTTAADGSYSFAPIAPGKYRMEVDPVPRLFPGSAIVTIAPGQAAVQDFALSAPNPLPAGASVDTGGGTTTSGVPVVNWQQPFSVRVPFPYRSNIGPAPPGTAGDRVVIYAGIGSLSPTGSPSQPFPGSMGGVLFSVAYDSSGRPVRNSPVFAGTATPIPQPDFTTPAGDRSAGATAHLADNCTPGIHPNQLGGLTLALPNGVFLDFNPIAIEAPQATGNLNADVIANMIVLAENAALNLVPEINVYNSVLGAANIAATINENPDWSGAGLANLFFNWASGPASPVHGPASFGINFMSGAAGFGLGQPTPPCAGTDWRPLGPFLPPIAIYIDPSGRVHTSSGVPLEGAKVVLSRSDTRTGHQVKVPNGSPIMSPANRRNPWFTGVDGSFAWDTIPGFYRIKATLRGCRGARTPVLAIPPPATHLSLTLRGCHVHRARTVTSLKVTVGYGGHAATLVAWVRTVARHRGKPVGVVTFREGHRILATVALHARNGRAIVVIPIRHGRPHFRASYGGDARYGSSRSPAKR